jgi:hypothetical protein
MTIKHTIMMSMGDQLIVGTGNLIIYEEKAPKTFLYSEYRNSSPI